MSEPSDWTTSQAVEGDSQLLFEPPAGGDLVLRTSDGVEFQVHSLILRLGSSVFDGMMLAGTTKDVVELSENAATLSLMLRFIYPNKKPPAMTSVDMLSDCLYMAQKYDLQDILKFLDEQTALNIQRPGPISADPNRVYQLAVQFSLPHVKTAVAQIISISQLDFSDPQIVPQLAQKHSPSVLFRLIALQNVRARVLSDVLFDFDNVPMLPEDELYYNLSCETCQITPNPSGDRAKLFRKVPTSWALAWVRLVYQTLLSTPLETSEFLFDASVLTRFEGADKVCQDCLNDFWKYQDQRLQFNEWVQGVKTVLQERLKVLEPLYPL